MSVPFYARSSIVHMYTLLNRRVADAIAICYLCKGCPFPFMQGVFERYCNMSFM